MPLYLPLILCCRRACVIRGQVVAIDGTPLVGVNVSFLHHSDYGFTISRQDGRYVSIASNHCGGQILTSSYKSNGLDDTVFVSPSSFYLYFRKSLVIFIFSISQLNQNKFFFYYNCTLLPKSSWNPSHLESFLDFIQFHLSIWLQNSVWWCRSERGSHGALGPSFNGSLKIF